MECLCGKYVRLRSRLKGTYLHADENGVSVSLSPDRASLNTAWRVEAVHLLHLRRNFVSLQSAAYGRYLAVSSVDAQRGRNHFLRQLIFYGERGNVDALWMDLKVWGGGGDVRLRHCRYSTHYIGVTVENPSDVSTRWVVETIPYRVQPPLLPIPNPVRDPRLRLCLRTIVYARADNNGATALASGRMYFRGRSVLELRTKLARRLGEENPSDITMCMWTGYNSPWIPLAIDLCADSDAMVIIVLKTQSLAALALRHPDVDAQ